MIEPKTMFLHWEKDVLVKRDSLPIELAERVRELPPAAVFPLSVSCSRSLLYSFSQDLSLQTSLLSH